MSSCRSSLDALKEQDRIPKIAGPLIIYPDSNIFLFKTNVRFRRDSEIIKPKFFKLVIPKGLMYYEMGDLSEFTFYYPRKQTVFIKINIDGDLSLPGQKKSYVPNEDDVTELIQGVRHHSSNKKIHIEKIRFKRNTKHLIIKDDLSKILFYNIDPKNYERFIDSFSRIHWLPDK